MLVRNIGIQTKIILLNKIIYIMLIIYIFIMFIYNFLLQRLNSWYLYFHYK